MRLDFNENTVGCSPKVIEFLKNRLSEETLSVYPDYTSVKKTLAAFFKVAPEEFILTNGTDEAIQVLVNTYVDDDDEVITLQPSYAMYRFYAEVAGAKIVDVPYTPPPELAFPIDALLAAITPATRAILIGNPNNPTNTGTDIETIARILKAAPHAAVLIGEAYFRILRRDRAADDPRLPGSLRQPHVFESLRNGCHASRLPVFAERQHRVSAQSAVALPTSRMLAAARGEAAVADTQYTDDYTIEALAAREIIRAGLMKLGIAQAPSLANFVLGYFGDRAVEVRDALREKAILVRDRSYEIAGGVRITAGTRAQAREVIAELEKIWRVR